MYVLAKGAGAGAEHLDGLVVLAVARCHKTEKSGPCRRAVAHLYATQLGPLLVAIVPDDDHDLAAIPSPRARREFAGSRDRTLAARSEWDLVDAVLAHFDGWHPEIPTVVCPEHDRRPFDRDGFVSAGRRRRGRTVDIAASIPR